jgi:hypothetical protein
MNPIQSEKFLNAEPRNFDETVGRNCLWRQPSAAPSSRIGALFHTEKM